MNAGPFPGATVFSRRTTRRSMISWAEMSDEELVTGIGRGREDALGELYDRFASRAYGLALRVVRDTHLAEDVVNESFLATWRSAGRFDSGRGTVQTWLLTIVHRRAVDLVRRERLRRADLARF